MSQAGTKGLCSKDDEGKYIAKKSYIKTVTSSLSAQSFGISTHTRLTPLHSFLSQDHCDCGKAQPFRAQKGLVVQQPRQLFAKKLFLEGP